jgi:hypothetical protein
MSINPHLAKVQKPILVIAAHDLTAHGAPQPRKSIAIALKSWRQYYSQMFEAVVVACGDEQTATIMDMNINRDIYSSALVGVTTFCDWSWNQRLLDLSVHKVLRNLSDMRLHQQERARMFGERSATLQDIMLETQTEGEDESAQAPPQTSVAVRSESKVAPPFSSHTVTGESSRSAFQRALEIRKAERIVHDPIESARMRLEYQKLNTEQAANARVIATHALRTFTAHKVRLEKEQKTRFDIEQRATVYGFPQYLKHHCEKLAELSLIEGNWHAIHATGFRSAFEVPKLDSDARSLAGDISKHLQDTRGPKGGPQSADLPMDAARSPRQRKAKIGRNMQLAGRGVIQNLIEQHEALGSVYS